MTNKEALISVLQVSVSDNVLEKALLDSGITSGSTYTAADAENIDKCAIPILQSLLSQPNTSEGGYSISFDRNAVQARIKMLATKYDLTDYLDPVPTISSKAIW